MIIGLSFCNWVGNKLQQAKSELQAKQKNVEGFQDAKEDRKVDMMEGAQYGLIFVVYMISVALLIMEIMLMVYSLQLAIRCSKPGMNRVAHVSMAFFFTFPYVLMSLFFSKCDAL